MATVGVAGTTTWGTTLAVLLSRRGEDVRLWARTEEEAARLRAAGENSRFLPGTAFPPSLTVTSSETAAFSDAELVIIAVPSRTLRENIRSVRPHLNEPTVVVSATKGLELDTGERMSQVLREELPAPFHSRICALSGPNLAGEIVRGKPSSTVIAAANPDAATRAQQIFNSPTFRVYTNSDIIGVEYGGALKNIVALGAGMCDGLGLGDNTKATFMTRGLAEIARLGVAAGADPMTFAGLAGVGDLIATCCSPLSRNRYFGEQLARGKSLEETHASMENVAEGVDTTAAAVALAKDFGVEMPIARATYDVLLNDLPLEQAVTELLGREPRAE